MPEPTVHGSDWGQTTALRAEVERLKAERDYWKGQCEELVVLTWVWQFGVRREVAEALARCMVAGVEFSGKVAADG